MSSSMEIAKRKSSPSSTALMPPPPPRKRIKRPAKVLDEDTYTEALSEIIARDYFPGLAEIEAQQEYLDSLKSHDKQWIGNAGRKLTEVMTPGPDGKRMNGRRGTSMTPASGLLGVAGDTPKGWTGGTPSSVVSKSDTVATESSRVDTNMSLSAFQARYTSEDNESFYKLLDKQTQQKAERHAWMWAGNKIPAARQIAYRKRQEQLEASKTAQEKEDGKEILRIDGGDLRKAMPDSWKAKPDNNLMFEPSGVADELQTVQARKEEISRAAPKAVIYENTRLPQPSVESSSTIPPSPSLSAVQDAIAGRPRISASESGAYAGSETPRVNGYAFVDSEPSPELEPEQDWSSLSFGSGDATPNPFTIKERSSREALHHRMVDKVAKSKRADKVLAQMKTPVPRFGSSPTVARGGLTPAAQRLLGKVGGNSTGGTLWTGTPKVRSGLSNLWTPKAKAAKDR